MFVRDEKKRIPPVPRGNATREQFIFFYRLPRHRNAGEPRRKLQRSGTGKIKRDRGRPRNIIYRTVWLLLQAGYSHWTVDDGRPPREFHKCEVLSGVRRWKKLTKQLVVGGEKRSVILV